MKINSLSGKMLSDLTNEEAKSYTEAEIQAVEAEYNDNYAVLAGILKSKYTDAVVSGVRVINFWREHAIDAQNKLDEIELILERKYHMDIDEFLSE